MVLRFPGLPHLDGHKQEGHGLSPEEAMFCVISLPYLLYVTLEELSTTCEELHVLLN